MDDDTQVIFPRPPGLAHSPYRPRTKPNRGPITYDGRKQSAKAWAAEAGVPYSTFNRRLHAGWTMAQAMRVGRFHSHGDEHAKARGGRSRELTRTATPGVLICSACGRPF